MFVMSSRIGRFEITEELASGGFGRVYRCRDPRFQRQVAIKVPSALTDKFGIARFHAEAMAAAQLHHKNIASIYEYGEDDGTPFIVMEYLDGVDLQQVIEGQKSRKSLSLQKKLEMMTEVAKGLNFAHASGVIHRDVKPANIMLLKDNSIKLMDFGIARIAGPHFIGGKDAGQIIGTLNYMAPEQFQSAAADVQTDIWSFGVVMYELLSGVHPFRADDPAKAMHRITTEEPPPITSLVPDCPPALDVSVHRLLSKDRERRVQSLDEFLIDVSPIIQSLRLFESDTREISTIHWKLTLNGSFEELDRSWVESFLEELRAVSGDTHLRIREIKAGSIIVRLEGSEEGYKILSELYNSGKITSIFGLNIQAIVKEERLSLSTPAEKNGINVVFSYSHLDGKLRSDLDKHLSALKRNGEIETWHDHMLRAGANIEAEIAANFDKAELILLLISANFLASDYCYGKEMKRALERHEAGEARVVPIILSPVDWHSSPLGKLLALPTDGRPITTWPQRDAGFLSVALGIRSVVDDLVGRRNRLST
jgi:serine/threonine protein kinase